MVRGRGIGGTSRANRCAEPTGGGRLDRSTWTVDHRKVDAISDFRRHGASGTAKLWRICDT
jgi:hypothetical protein